MVVTAIGIDPGESVCVAVGRDRRGEGLARKELSRQGPVCRLATLPACPGSSSDEAISLSSSKKPEAMRGAVSGVA
jgi:hypothetical protein